VVVAIGSLLSFVVRIGHGRATAACLHEAKSIGREGDWVDPEWAPDVVG